jgi:hypothetical protein
MKKLKMREKQSRTRMIKNGVPADLKYDSSGNRFSASIIDSLNEAASGTGYI